MDAAQAEIGPLVDQDDSAREVDVHRQTLLDCARVTGFARTVGQLSAKLLDNPWDECAGEDLAAVLLFERALAVEARHRLPAVQTSPSHDSAVANPMRRRCVRGVRS